VEGECGEVRGEIRGVRGSRGEYACVNLNGFRLKKQCHKIFAFWAKCKRYALRGKVMGKKN
jgi:hypothetical protein